MSELEYVSKNVFELFQMKISPTLFNLVEEIVGERLGYAADTKVEMIIVKYGPMIDGSEWSAQSGSKNE